MCTFLVSPVRVNSHSESKILIIKFYFYYWLLDAFRVYQSALQQHSLEITQLKFLEKNIYIYVHARVHNIRFKLLWIQIFGRRLSPNLN